MTDIEILILAGGKGTRLSSVVRDVPKPMALIGSEPFLKILIDSVKIQGFSKFRLLVGYKAEVIQSYFGNGSQFGLDIQYTLEDSPLGTGGAIKKAIGESQYDRFLIFNGDTLFEADLSDFISASSERFSLALRYIEDSARYGQVKIDQKNLVSSFIEKNEKTGPGLVNAGIYYFTRQVLKYFPNQEAFSAEQEVMPRLAQEKLLMGFPLEGKFIDIGIPEDFLKAQNYLKEFRFKKLAPAQ